ncbi:MAG TPA: hypothetical protein VF103_10385 [Polyangiaceae bacterium]
MKRVSLCAAFVSCVTFGCSVGVGDEPSREAAGTEASELRRFVDFDVSFADCVESIGVTLASTDTVGSLVPSPFVPVGAGTPVTPLVVRTASCGRISVDGKRGSPGSVVQLGAVIVPPDGTGDINNYTFRYYSDAGKLVEALERAGLSATKARIDYRFDDAVGAPSLDVAVKAHGRAELHLGGVVAPTSAPAGSFLANWWVDTRRGALEMSTNVPAIAIGSAALVLDVRADGDLDELFGATSIAFPILQQFNAFDAAEMHVSRND